MQHLSTPWATPETHLSRIRPDHPVMYLSPAVLQATARRFQQGFDGLVTYAVKANDRAEVLANLVAAGVTAFDVASPVEMQAVRAALPDAVLHYNNPVRSEAEIAAGIAHQVASWSVDDATELDKLAEVPKSCEISVRFALPVEGAAYDFGEKFGATKDEATVLLRCVQEQGWSPSLCFHPGTQCEDASAWARYIEAAAEIAQAAGVTLARLNVGGGFAAHRNGQAPDLEGVFQTIRETVDRVFADTAPALICEPGRAMVSEAFVLATRIKGMKQDGRTVFLNDGIYGGLVDLRDMGLMDRVRVVSDEGTERTGSGMARIVFGPTCDSLDRLPDGLVLPDDTQTGDYLLIAGMGAYSVAMSTVFNGYGLRDVATVLSFSGQ
ncbi:type III PLP-dependent enzyme [Falsiruegeria mediterranea]|uniref:ornithine decarboxylase n=1 Tax=Falsiruegeria mediterranea M17 TaxID=1200281 RepID=A0A2R8CCS3_9RHOB|nr:type III PLP-dependent enzyme [Falsiruegeria mediterranea]SPJ30233.1 Lysine/ornithine decarboxylase [Falsiruegeria mediterranea M17]